MAKDRKVDVLAPAGTLTGQLKKRRQAVEDDKLEEYEDERRREYANSSTNVVKRGYRVEIDE